MALDADQVIKKVFDSTNNAIKVSGGGGNWPDGTEAAPGAKFTLDTDTGISRPAANILAISTGGTERARVSSSGLTTIDGTAAAPSIAFTSDADTGIFLSAAGTLAFATSGTQRVRVLTQGLLVEGSGNATSPSFLWGGDGNTGFFHEIDVVAITTGGTERLRVDAVGNVGIGASPAASALLELSSTTGALLVPRMTTTQRDALTAVDGMIIYNTTTATMQGRVAGAWVNL